MTFAVWVGVAAAWCSLFHGGLSLLIRGMFRRLRESGDPARVAAAPRTAAVWSTANALTGCASFLIIVGYQASQALGWPSGPCTAALAVAGVATSLTFARWAVRRHQALNLDHRIWRQRQ